jgi:hypothetical protein
MTLDQIPAPVADVNMNNFYITNIAMPAVPGPGDVVNVTYLTTYVTDAIAAGTIELTGAVTASGTIGTPFATSLNSTVALPTGGTTFTTTEQFSGMKIKSNFVPPSGQISNIDIKIENQVGSYARFRLGSTDAAGVDPNGTFAVDFQPAVGDYTQVFAFNNTYMSLFLPLAVQEDMNMTSNRIYNLANPVLPNDATNKTYVDALSAVSGSFSIGGNLDMTTGQINNVAMAETPASTDAVNVSYMNSRIATLIAAGSVTLTGAVTGTGFVGTPFATSLNSTVALPTGGTTFTTTEQFSGMKIKNNYFTGTSGNQTVDLKLVNSIGASVRFLMNSTGSSGTNPDGAFSLNFLNSDASVETQVFSSTKTAMTIYLPLSVEEGMNMTNNKIINLATPTLSNDAATKGYVDGRTITLTGNVTGTGTVGSSFSTTLAMTLNTIPVPVASVSLNSQKIINLASPTTGTDAANRTFVETGATQYGGLYSSGGLSVSLTAGVWAKVTALNTIGSLSSFTAPPVSYRLVYSGPTTRVFCLNANVTFTCPLSNNGMFFGICVNGVLISPSVLNLVTSTSTLTTNNISICGYANLASTDYVEVWVYSNNNTTITVQSAQLAVFAI